MTRPYKFALAITVLICGTILVYYMGPTGLIGRQDGSPSNAAASISTAPQNDTPSDQYSPQISRLLNHLHEKKTPSDPKPKTLKKDPEPKKVDPPTLTIGTTKVDPVFPIVSNNPVNSFSHKLNNDPSNALSLKYPAASRRTRDKYYTIRPGDTFSSIAVTLYGSERYWVDIAQANPGTNPNRLDVGDAIRLPAQHHLHRRGQGQAVKKQPSTYTVRPGDSLYTIAGEYYDAPNLWRVIYEANRTRIGQNPATLEAGMALVLPPAPEIRQ